MWNWILRKAGLKPNLERRVAALEYWRDAHEETARTRALRVESDISMIGLAINDLRAEIESERKERFATVMEAFSLAAEGIITRVLSNTRGELGIGRADMQDLKARVNALELRGEDGK